MRICLIIDHPRYEKLPIIRELVEGLGTKYEVQVFNVQTAAWNEELATPADLYLLKSHGPQSLDFAHQLEQQGALVINSSASTSACQDREVMTHVMNKAGLPWPKTLSFSSLQRLLADTQMLASMPFPFIVKSKHNHDDELIEQVYNLEHLHMLAERWGQEPIIVQEWIIGDGWDTKVWVIDEQIFAAKRRSPLDHKPKDQFQLTANQIGKEIREIALDCGRAFGLRIFGLDFLITEQGPIVMDVNSFPGLRNLIGPEKAIINLVERLETAPALKWQSVQPLGLMNSGHTMSRQTGTEALS
ncbi:hypothetical protein EPA93_37665 [Ktedonosporobacter rubrisoli]|uniref:ATP-grasp domain-containing protein n=1 Tax=Ktedonosporobacter rubrisoli TaxID=2509675 RepID=A0A4P6JZX6_KTERU|nr:hypothetical protein [Ktedonosporobacter rubrisoli]QBD81397.1 hypothetical protein EPA93_37665 [Ktedonosporobacter rubrisoli]